MGNQRITDLTKVNNFSGDGDLIPIIINTGTVPVNAAITKANFAAAIGGGGGGSFVTLDTAQIITGEKTFNADVYFTGERYIYFEDGQFLEISDINGDNYIVIDNDIVDVSGKKFSIGSTTSANVVYTDGAAGDPLIIDARENNVIFDLGTNGNRVTPNIGDVLVCTDTSGKVEWQTTNKVETKITTATGVTGTYDLDYEAEDSYDLTLTGATTLTESNAPSTGRTQTLFIFATGGDITLPTTGTNFVTGTYDGAENNWIVIKYFNTIKEKNIKGINNITPSYNKLIISYDLKVTNFSKIKQEIEKLSQSEDTKTIGKNLEIPVCCDVSFSLDIERLEKKLSIKRDQILENFFNKEFFCYMTGFIAGMPFLGDLDEQMRAQRLETPRVKVPKGSVGMTEQFANIYTFESPGGWNIIGNTPLEVFDSSKETEPNLINPGDAVKFKQITFEEYKNYNEQ